MTIAAKPIALHRWAYMTDLNGLGEATMTVNIGNAGVIIGTPEASETLLLISINPRTAEISRAASVAPSGETTKLTPLSLPYMVRDLAETLTREHFPNASQPIGRGLR